jgi:hypothetical protein
MLAWMQVYSILTAAVLILAALCVSLLVLLLVVPFNLALEFTKRGPPMRGFYRVAWLGFTLRKGVFLPPSLENMMAPSENETRAGEKEEPTAEKAWNLKHSPDLRSLLDAIPALFRVLKDMLESIDLRNISCHLCFGLDDPVETAIMSGYLWSAASALGLFRANIFIEPCFEGGRLEGELAAEIRTRMLWMVMPMILSLREQKIRKLLAEMARGT